MTKATLAYAILGFCFGMLTVIVAEAISTKLAPRKTNKIDELSKSNEISAGPIDLRTCKKGDQLISRGGFRFTYLYASGAGRFPHKATYDGTTMGSFTDSGRFLPDADSKYDIVRIVHLNGDQK